jgi:hypothetical protein
MTHPEHVTRFVTDFVIDTHRHKLLLALERVLKLLPGGAHVQPLSAAYKRSKLVCCLALLLVRLRSLLLGLANLQQQQQQQQLLLRD